MLEESRRSKLRTYFLRLTKLGGCLYREEEYMLDVGFRIMFLNFIHVVVTTGNYFG
jgi:hypothetical protein